jgi:hypothetical protein
LSEGGSKAHLQRIRLSGAGMVLVGQQPWIKRPEVIGEMQEDLTMSKEVWHQLLVMTIFMNPTQSQLVHKGLNNSMIE